METHITQPTILVIIGIGGDLSRRYLLPAMGKIAKAGVLPEQFRMVGVSRKGFDLDDMPPAAKEAGLEHTLDMLYVDLADQASYKELRKHLDKIEQRFGVKAQRLFHLAVPPFVAPMIVEHLGEAGLLGRESSKLLLEKPFGTDLDSAEDLVAHLKRYCREDQLYRIDHYLAKEMAQNLLVFRSTNSLFARAWDNQSIDSIDIVASETIGIEGRAAFYEQTGALRDFVQNHLLQLAALVLMEPPKQDDWQAIPAQRLAALQALIPPDDVRSDTVRGQYEGYRDEVGNPDTQVETYVSIKLFSRDPRWEGVPITLTTGKALSERTTEIRLRFRQEGTQQPNELTLRIQPNEGATLRVWVKRPGFEHSVQMLPLELSFGTHFAELPGAYERVFVDAMRADHTLFTTSDEVLASWRILAPVQQAWDMSDGSDLVIYPKGLGASVQEPHATTPRQLPPRPDLKTPNSHGHKLSA